MTGAAVSPPSVSVPRLVMVSLNPSRRPPAYHLEEYAFLRRIQTRVRAQGTSAALAATTLAFAAPSTAPHPEHDRILLWCQSVPVC